MDTVILAGGKGTRISELTTGKSAVPKPLVQANKKPLLWHIMSNYSRFGHNSFLIAGGYLQEQIKDYFLKLSLAETTITIHTKTGELEPLNTQAPDWDVTIVNTGEDTMTGGRLLRLKDYVDDTFFFTYGDGISDVDIKKLLEFHKSHNRLCTVTTVPSRSQYGILHLTEDGHVDSFAEKPTSENDYINAGYFVCEKGVFEYIDDDMSVWEQDPMKRLLVDDQLIAYRHDGFWKSVDSLKDLNDLNSFIDQGVIPWLDPVE